MSFQVTDRLQALSEQIVKSPQIIFEVDGIDLIFGTLDIDRVPKFGEEDLFFGMPDLFFGGVIKNPKGRAYISLKGGTSNSINQQIQIDKGGTTSISALKVALIDKNSEMSALFTPNLGDKDLLGRSANVYLNLKGGAHPEDSIRIFNGIIDSIDFPSGLALISISHPDQLRRQELFPEWQSKLVEAISDTDDEIKIESFIASQMMKPSGGVIRTFIKIDKEIIEFTDISGNTLLNCTRGMFGTIPDSYDIGDDTTTFYQVTGAVIPTLLKLMLSGGTEWYSTLDVGRFDNDERIFIPMFNGIDTYNIQAGDTVEVYDSTSNDQTTTIAEAIYDDIGFYLRVNGTVIHEPLTTAKIRFKSQYNTLNHGCGLTPNQVDIDQHLEMDRLYSQSFPAFEYYVKSPVNAKDFFDKEMLFPYGMYLLPRKGRVSCKASVPPLASSDITVIDSSNIIDPSKLRIGRSINKLFYNHIVYRYEQSATEDRYLAGFITQSGPSVSRIPIGVKPLIIDAKGIREDGFTRTKLEQITSRMIMRYQYGAETIKVTVQMGAGYNVEIGDLVIFGDSDLRLTDSTSGNRDFAQRVMEVTNKVFNITTGRVDLELTNTNFGTNARFAVISPSSIIDVGSSLGNIRLKRSYQTALGAFESDKWRQFSGTKIIIHDSEYEFIYEAIIIGVDPSDRNSLLVEGLSILPPEDYIVDVAPYFGTRLDNGLAKAMFAYSSNNAEIVSGTSGFIFEVDDATGLFIGASLIVRNLDYDTVSPETIVDEINGNVITVRDDLGFTPSAGMIIDAVQFSDGGYTYRYY